MFTNDLGKLLSKDLEQKSLKLTEYIDILSRLTRILDTLKHRETLPGGLLKLYRDLFEDQEGGGESFLHSAGLRDLCFLFRVSSSRELLSLS